MPGEIRLFWCFYGVTYNFIQNHNHWRDLHQIFSCLFETFGTMSAIMFSSDSMSIFFSTAENTWMSTFLYNIIVLEWLGNNGSKIWEWQEFPPLPLLIPININCHPYTSHFRLPKQPHNRLMPRSPAIFEKKWVLHQKGCFPVKSKLSAAELWYKSWKS